ncbi:MAG: hypothetical protein CMM93_02750, partial [Rickettsiales bacterium]|nr:hypothetical protein [Rickettsiales bacterium]
MALNSINTNIAAISAQSNINKANSASGASISRLSSGNRITRAADDVAALSAGTSLRTNVTTLKTALINTSQGASLLQVADGALSQITDILQRQKSIAVQAGSGSLTNAERSFLNQEFQNLTSEIDRLAEQTNFNGVALLNGSLSEKVNVSDVKEGAKSASASITFNTNPAVGETLVLNGQTFTAVAVGATAGAAEFALGANVQETLDNLVSSLNASTNTSISQATYTRSGNSLVITADQGGLQGRNYTINAGTSTAINAANDAVVNAEGAAVTNNLFTAAGLITASSTDSVVTAAAAAQNTPFQVGQTLTVNGTDVLGGSGFLTGDTLESIVNRINSRQDVHGVKAEIIGASGAYNIKFESTTLTTDASYLAASATDIAFTGAAATVALTGYTFAAATDTDNQFIYTLSGGDDLGIGGGDTLGVGSAGNDLITNQNQKRAEVSIIFNEIADNEQDSATNFGTARTVTIGGTNGVTFQFSTNSGETAATEVAVGATLEDTLDNLVAKINSYDGTSEGNSALNKVEAYRDGTTVKIRAVDVGNQFEADTTTTLAVALNGGFPGSVTNGGSLNNGQDDGVTTSGITNSDFVGTIQGFTATYGGTTDTVDLEIKVGDFTYVAENVDTTPTADTKVRFSSQDGGGYFDVELAANKGNSVTSQAGADSFASRLDAALSSISFYQTREVSSYTGKSPILADGVVTGSLLGTSVSLRQDDFANVTIDSIRVKGPQGSNENASISFTIGGVEYKSAGNIGSTLGANQTYDFVSADNAQEVLKFTTGDSEIQLNSDSKAKAFQDALAKAFGVGNSDASLKFQVGVTTADTLSVKVDNVTSGNIFQGKSLDVLTQASAAAASDAIDAALDVVTSARANVGALQSRFDFAAANIESSIANQDAARGVLLDTDVAAESTAFATSQVQLQAGISVLA